MKTDNIDNKTAVITNERGGTEEDISSSKNQECTSCEQNFNEGAPCELLDIMSISDVGSISICANCGKEGSSIVNTCNKCKSVKYCNAACKKKHRHKHKKQCERIVSELHDEALFKQPPPPDDCPLCFLRMPSLIYGSTYMSCCGKIVCNGCAYATAKIDLDKQLCAFCRTPAPDTEEECMERSKTRVFIGDAEAIYHLACDYRDGTCGFPQDMNKALELFHQAGELGHSSAYYNIGCAHESGRSGVEVDKNKAKQYYELAAMKGDADARHNLGIMEGQACNIGRALKHYMIAVSSGDAGSLKTIQKFHSNGHTTKDDYTAALQGYQAYLGEIKSAQRDEAATYREDFKYY